MMKKIIRKMNLLRNRLLAEEIILGRYTALNKGCEVRGILETGDFCAIGRNIVFQGVDHDYAETALQHRFQRQVLDREPRTKVERIQLGSDVWIGSNAIILPGVEIGDGGVVGAGAVVTKDVEPYEIVGGVPAENIGWRFPEHVRRQLLEIEWWDWSEDKIRQNQEFFELDLSEIGEGEDLRDYIK